MWVTEGLLSRKWEDHFKKSILGYFGRYMEKNKIKINKADQNCNSLHKKQWMLLNKGNDSERRNKFGN